MEFVNNSLKRKDGKSEVEEQRSRGVDGVISKDSDDMETEQLVFEDPFGDEFEEEVFDEERFEDEENIAEEYDQNVEENNHSETIQKQHWRPGIDQIGEDEELEYDPSAYIMYHPLRTEWPCLSFDILRDDLGDNRQRFPLTMYIVSGSQADKADKNKITLMKLSDLHRSHIQQDSDGENEEEDDDEDEDPTIEHLNIPHQGGVNRIRSMPQNPGIVATMSDTGHAHIFDITASYKSLQSKSPRLTPSTKPLFTFKGHRQEGYAIDWSSAILGRLATGDCNGSIHIWNATESSYNVSQKPHQGHTSSVEDIQWSPAEGTVFASASADKTVRIWDTRGLGGPQITVNAHDEDVNVISWNRTVSYLLASGCDDGSFKVWDLRAVRNKSDPLAHFRYHNGHAITSIDWAPHDESVLCLSSADHQVTIWDLSVEADDAAAPPSSGPQDYPPQLLFIHQGQKNVKEVHHHPQVPGVIATTAEDGFNVFKPAITVS